MKTALCVLGVALLWLPALSRAGAKIEISDNRYVTLGAGLRTSFAYNEDGAPNGSDSKKDFELESFRFYSGGQLMKGLGFDFNAEYDGDQELRVLDGIVKLEMSQTLNIWAGRFLPPSDRANLSGPYFLNSFDFPFVQQYPAIFAGRDEGVAYWGQVGEGMLKWQAGIFEGSDDGANDEDGLLYTGRLTLNLWDPESGYYNSSTYYGEKEVLAIGLVGMSQNDGGGVGATSDGDFRGWNVDFLMEKNLSVGTLSLEGAFYDYDRDDAGTPVNEGDGYFAVVSWLLPGKIGSAETISARIQPLVRYQSFDPEMTGFDRHQRVDVGVNFIIDGHNARVSLAYSQDRDDPGLASGADSKRGLFKIGVQIQI
jgi:hypothetical protein